MSSTRRFKSNRRKNSFKFIVRQKQKNERSEILKTSLAIEGPVSPIEGTTPSPIQEKEVIVEEEPTDLLSPSTTAATITAVATVSPTPSTQYTESTSLSSTTTDQVNILDPTMIFPFTNKPHETRKKTIAEESKQWESLFDPQYTFGSFQHGIAKPITAQFYRGKWPLDQEDIIGMIPTTKKKKNKSRGVVDPNATTPFSTGTTAADELLLFPTVPSPTLPNIKHLQLHINTNLIESTQELDEGNGQIEILPCPSLSQFPKYKQTDDEKLWKERLELLNEIQILGFNKELNDGTQSNPYRESATARLQRQIRDKAEKIKRETLVDSSTEEEEDNEVEEHQSDDEFHGLHVAIEPDDTLLFEFEEKSPTTTTTTAAAAAAEEEEESPPIEQSSLASIDSYENISFHAPTTTKEPENNDDDLEKKVLLHQQEPEIKRKNRASFLFFAYGFLFPPLWMIGALYVPSSKEERTSASKNIDKKWKKYSRNALSVFLVSLVTTIVLILVLKPQAVGFRNSSEQGYQEERVVFDEDVI